MSISYRYDGSMLEETYDAYIKPNMDTILDRLRFGGYSFVAATYLLFPNKDTIILFDVSPMKDCLYNTETIYFQYLVSLKHIFLKTETHAMYATALRNVILCRGLGLTEKLDEELSEDHLDVIRSFYDL